MPDRTVRLWQIGASPPLATYSGHLADVDVVRFLHDATGLVSASSDGEVHEWPFASDRSTMLDLARTLTPRCLNETQLAQFGLQQSATAWCSEARSGVGHQELP
jgi:WD40 repeat protein